jgi:hypothetical protein
MAAANTAFERVIALQLQRFSPEEARKQHIAIARRGLAEFTAGEAPRPGYRIETDGHRAASEEEVVPFGVIAYRFLRLPDAARYALETAIEISPAESGRYKHSWFLMADGAEITPEAIAADAAEIVLTNDQPYSRKIELRGARLADVPPGIVERVRQIVLQRFGGTIEAGIEYISLGRGYRLKGGRSRRRARAERALTYPALVMRGR